MPRRSGFTLVELLVVISIIAILSAIAMTVYSQVTMNARDARRKLDLQTIAQALEVYYQKNNRYPISGWVFSDRDAPWISDDPQAPFTAAQLVPDYISSLPVDPKDNTGRPWFGGLGYTFCSNKDDCYSDCEVGNGQWYLLIAVLENPNDLDRHGIKNYKLCDGDRLRWSDNMYVITPNQ